MTAPRTVGDAFTDSCRRLAEAGVAAPRLDVRLLLEHVLGAAEGTVLGQRDRPLGADVEARLATLVARRIDREPLARILGTREFWSLPFRVNDHTLVPRPDSETLVEAALEHVAGRHGPLSVLDLGTGSGCLLLAVLSEVAAAHGVGVDIDGAALAVARDNAHALGLGERAHFVQGDWATALGARFDLVLANPPYIATADVDGLEPEVAAFDPRRALDGGSGGLDCYRALAPQLPALLAPAATAVIEVGAGQAAAVAIILDRHQLGVAAVRRDLAGVERCIVATAGKD
jgi:release factor glutamine methyltransferase